MKNAIAFVFASISAYTFSFAIDLLIGGLFKIYPNTAFLPVVTWAVIATVAVFVALRLAPQGRFLVIPFALIALIALFGGIVGHRYSLIVAAVMFAETVGIWLVTTQKTKQELSGRTAAPFQ